MTQKELLYYEDAINHEDSIIKIINHAIDNLKDDELKSFMQKEVSIHNDLKQNLINMLGEKANG